MTYDFYFRLPLYGQFPTKSGFCYNYTTCSFLQSLLTIWMHKSCSFDMSYVITFDIWEVRIMSYILTQFSYTKVILLICEKIYPSTDINHQVYINNNNSINVRKYGSAKNCLLLIVNRNLQSRSNTLYSSIHLFNKQSTIIEQPLYENLTSIHWWKNSTSKLAICLIAVVLPSIYLTSKSTM